MATADRHLVLDAATIVELWCGSRAETRALAELMQRAPANGWQLWIAASQLSSLETLACRRMEAGGAAPAAAHDTAREKVAGLLAQVQVLSSFGHEQPQIYARARNIEQAQVAASARRLDGGGVAIVTHDPSFDALDEVACLSPQEALERLDRPGEANTDAVPFIDLSAQLRRLRPEIERRVDTVLGHGKYIMGPEVGELETRLAAYAGVDHAIGVSSGTDALLIALMALEIGPGDEVITSPFSFISTAETVGLLGAKTVFVDIDPITYNIDASRIEPAITSKTRAIIPVSLYGQPADFEEINRVADKHGLPVIEDAAQSFGATYKGRPSCGLSTIGCTSFFPSKPLGGYGDGGACFTDDPALAKRMREIRVHGQDRRYHHPVIGLNGRLDTLQAAILLAKLDILPGEIEARQRVAKRYNARLAEHHVGPGHPGPDGNASACAGETDGAASSGITLPEVKADRTSAWAQYTVSVSNRETVQARLKQAGIPTAVYYPVPLYRQPVFEDSGAKPADFPNCEALQSRVLSLPMHPYLTHADQDRISDALDRAVRAA